MTTRARITTIAALMLALAAPALVAGCGGDDDGGGAGTEEGGGTVKFGLITDITKFSDFGLRTQDGVELAVDQINEDGGINGSRVELVFADSAGNPQEAATLTRRMAADDDVLAIWGPFTSGEAEVAFRVAEQVEVPIIASTSAKPGLTEEGEWAFRNTATEDKVLAPALEEFGQRYDLQRVAIAYDAKEPVAKATGELVFPMLAEQAGLEIVNASDPVTFETGTQNFSAQVTRLKGLDAQGLLLGTTAEDAGRLAREMARQGVDIPAIGGVSMFNESLIEVGGEAVDGWYSAQVFWKDSTEPEVQQFVEEIRERHREDFAGNPDPIPDSATWYDSARITMEIAADEGIDGSTPLEQARESIRAGWANLEGYEGVTGATDIDETGQALKEIFVFEVKDGEWVKVGSSAPEAEGEETSE
jgi:branched-chain amino acid transport system substrate-binding protein